MNNNDNTTRVAKDLQTLENAPRDYYALEVDQDLELPAPTWAGRAAWRRDFEEDLEDILGERYGDYDIRGLVAYMRDRMEWIGDYWLEPEGAGDEWLWVILPLFDRSNDPLRQLEKQDTIGFLEREGLQVSKDWAIRWQTEHSVRVTYEGEETTLDFKCLYLARENERREVWVYYSGDGAEVFDSLVEAMEWLEENVGYEFLEPLGGYQG